MPFLYRRGKKEKPTVLGVSVVKGKVIDLDDDCNSSEEAMVSNQSAL